MGVMKNLSSSSPIVFSAGIAAFAVGSVAAPALAEDPQSERANADLVSLLNAQVAPRHPSARYTDAASGRSFTLDRTGPYPLLKYEDVTEVIVLSASNAQRGDEFLKNDVGRNVMKVTELGNVILFTPGDAHGSPAGLDERSDPLGLPEYSGDLDERIAGSAEMLAQKIGHDIAISIEPELRQYANWAEDALSNAERGFRRANSKFASELTGVRIVFSKGAFVYCEEGVLSIGVAPHEGFAGRPSSEAIALAISLNGHRS